MSANAPWLVGVVFAVGFLGIALLVRYALRETRIVFRRRHLVCPASHEEVDALLVAQSDEAPFLGVRRCTAYGGGPVLCDKACLRALNDKRA